MTLMSSISKLTTSVDKLTNAANVTKAQLDAKVAQADAEVVVAQAEQTGAEAARDEAAAHATDAATHLATVKADVTYEGISTIFSEMAVTAVDVFVYDTSLDSDGGAWRKRCQHTSWYNEPLNTATRGGRRDFPAVTVIVATNSTVTIYDADDPDLPMWMVIPASTSHARIISWGNDGRATGIAAKNGILVTSVTSSETNASVNGLFLVEFPADRGRKYAPCGIKTWPYDIARRDTTGLVYFNAYCDPAGAISSLFLNAVAMTVFPAAPIDQASGLPVPTIAVASAAGISVIRDNGSVVDLINYVTAPATLAFVEVGGVKKIWTTSRYRNWVGLFDIPDADFNTGAYIWGLQNGGNITWFGDGFSETETALVAGATRGVVIFNKDESLTNLNGASTASRWQQMTAALASDYTTGWLPGDVRGAFLSGVDSSDLLAAELVTNGTFDVDTTGWSAPTSAAIEVDAGRLKVTSNSGNWEYALQTLPVVVGRAYRVCVTGENGNVAPFLYLGSTTGGFDYAYQSLPSGVERQSHIVARTNLLSIRLNPYAASAGDYAFFNNVSVFPVEADRSVNNKGLIVNGTITRSPVVGGAELVGCSGFSAANYLEQPYNNALDFGTGDFCVTGWVRQIAGSAGYVMERRLPDGTGAYIRIYLDGNTIPVFGTNGRTLVGSKPCGLNQWAFVTCVRSGSDMAIYVNGALDATVSGIFDVSSDGAILRFGRAINVSALPFYGNLALWRISATAPTPNQIAKIYEDERKLFQPGAQCTIYGTSDAVTAVAHDPKTNLLHVGTSQGRSVFDGLVRVANTETPVTTAISAVGGMIAEQ